MKRIVIKTQAELDILPLKFDEYTVIEIRSEPTTAIYVVQARDSSTIVARDSSTVEARDSSTIVARDSSTVEAWDSSRVEAWDSSRVVARGSSRVEAWDSSRVVARDSSTVEAWGSSRVEAWGSSTVEAWGSSRVEAWGSSTVEARDSSTIVARDSSTVEARDSSTIVARDSSRVEARDSSRVDCFQSSFVMILSSAVILKSLLDYSTAHFKQVIPTNIEDLSLNATVKHEPDYEITFDEWLRRGYVNADGINKKLLSQKNIGEITVFEVEEFLENRSSYVVRRDDTFSHGETVEKAIADLRYKISDRDTSKYDSWKTGLDVMYSIDDAISGYRTITGACEFGTKQFVESLGHVPEFISPNEILKLTEGQFGNDKLKEFLS